MSKRYEHLHYCEYRDVKTGLVASNFVEVMNEQDQKIKELEQRLANCIEPKYKVGDKCWYIYGKRIKSFIISKIEIEIRICPLIAYSSAFIYQYEENCFATEEEAKEKLEELKNG